MVVNVFKPDSVYTESFHKKLSQAVTEVKDVVLSNMLRLSVTMLSHPNEFVKMNVAELLLSSYVLPSIHSNSSQCS